MASCRMARACRRGTRCCSSLRNGPLVLFYKVGPSPREWWGMMMTSSDAGTTWSTPKRSAGSNTRSH